MFVTSECEWIKRHLEDFSQNTIMAPSISSACASFVQSLSQIGISILSAIMGVLYAILGLGQTLFASVVQLGQSVLKCKCTVFLVQLMGS